MGDVTYLLTAAAADTAVQSSPASSPPSAEEEAPLAALFLRSIHLRRNIESQEFIHAAIAVAVVDPPASCLPVARQTDRQTEGGGNFHFHFPPYYSHMRRNNPT